MTEITLPDIHKVATAFSELQSGLTTLRNMLLSCDRPIWLPEQYEFPYSVAANTLCSIWHQDDSLQKAEGGIICADDELFNQVIKVNSLKSEFKNVCHPFSQSHERTTRLKTSIATSNVRNKELNDAMKSIGIGQLRLWSCYKKICTIESGVYRARFTLQRNHTSKASYDKEEVIELCRKYYGDNPSLFEAYATVVRSLQNTDEIIRVSVKKKFQRRMNYVFKKGGENNTFQSPSIVIIKSSSLPIIGWTTESDLKKYITARADTIRTAKPLGFLGFYSYPSTKKDKEQKPKRKRKRLEDAANKTEGLQ